MNTRIPESTAYARLVLENNKSSCYLPRTYPKKLLLNQVVQMDKSSIRNSHLRGADARKSLSALPSAKDSTEAADQFDKQLKQLTNTLEALETKCQMLSNLLRRMEADKEKEADRARQAELQAAELRVEKSDILAALQEMHLCQQQLQEEKGALKQEIERREVLLETQRLDAKLVEKYYKDQVEREQQLVAKFKVLRDDALLQRDDALSELASAYADLDTLQTTLADSAVFVRYLRKRVMELELEKSTAVSKAAAAQRNKDAEDAFSLAKVRASVKSAVQEAMAHHEEERKKRIRALQLRWHPDKNPVLRDIATEVTKIINETVAEWK